MPEIVPFMPLPGLNHLGQDSMAAADLVSKVLAEWQKGNDLCSAVWNMGRSQSCEGYLTL